MEFINDKKKWNDLILKNKGSFLQSWEWGDLQEKINRKTWKIISGDLAALLLKYKLPIDKYYFYCPSGPLPLNSNPDWKKFAEEIEAELSEKDSIFLKIEPWSEKISPSAVKSAGFRKSNPLQPREASIIDLKKPADVILSEMEYEARYAIKTAEKRGVKILEFEKNKEEKFEGFWNLFLETNLRRKLKFHSKEYYRQVLLLSGDCYSRLFIANLNNRTIGAAIVVYFGKTAYYLYAASAVGFGKYNAPTFLLWNIISDAKEKGFEILDLGGISRKKKSWAGITAFKKSLGGKEIVYPGAWDYPLNKNWYFVYKIAKKILK